MIPPNPLNPNPNPQNYWANLFYSLLYHTLERVKIHGLPYLIIIMFAYYLYNKVSKLELEVHQCNSDMIDLYRKDQQDTRDVIQANTEVLKDLRKQIK